MAKERKYIIMLVLLACILLVTPSTIRMLQHNSYMSNSEAYNNIRIYNQGDTKYDSLQGRSIPLNIINLIRLNDYAKQILFNIIPILLGLLTVALAYLILQKQNISEKIIITIVILIIVSPIFIYTFTDYKIYSFIIFLNMLGLYFLMHENVMFSSATFAIIPFIDPFSGIVTLALLLTYMFSNHKHRTNTKIISIVLLTSVVLSIILNTYYGYNALHMFRFNMHNILTDIGADIGVSFSIVILTTIGLILLWENGWRTLVTYIILLLFIVASLFNDTIRIYLNFILMIYAGFAFMYLNKRKWSISIIKKTTVLLIICSIFFSTLVYMTKLTKSEPTPEYVDGLKFIKEQSLPTEVVLSSPVNGYIVEYYTERMVLVDESTKYRDNKKYVDMENITSSRNLERTEKMLKEYNIKYIIVDSEFEPYLIERDGLLFLIETSHKFTSIYKNDRIEVWMYNG
jgi:hypothetical protein